MAWCLVENAPMLVWRVISVDRGYRARMQGSGWIVDVPLAYPLRHELFMPHTIHVSLRTVRIFLLIIIAECINLFTLTRIS